MFKKVCDLKFQHFHHNNLCLLVIEEWAAEQQAANEAALVQNAEQVKEKAAELQAKIDANTDAFRETAQGAV